MNRLSIVTLSLSEIASSVFSKKLRPLQQESLGAVQLINLDVKSVESQARKVSHNSIVILNLPIWSTEQEDIIRHLRAIGFYGPILAMVKNLTSWNLDSLDPAIFRRVSFLEQPVETDQLIGLLRRMVASETTHSRTHPRYEMEQQAEILSIDKEGKAKNTLCLVKNVSLGGACLEFKGEIPFNEGTFVTLNLNIDGKSGNLNTVRGRIAWIQSHKAQVGVEFTGPVAV